MHNDTASQYKNNSSEEDSIAGVGTFLWEIVKVCVLAYIIIVPIRAFLFQPFFVQGASMDPNFKNGQYLIIGELGYKKTDVNLFGLSLFTVHPSKEFTRQEIVVFHPPIPVEGEKFFIKRIIGLPGETVEIKNGQVIIINKEHPEGQVLDESAYLSTKVPTYPQGSSTSYSVHLADDEYFVMGDNRPASHDSRAFGPITKDKVTGRVLLRAWPLGESRMY